LNIIFLDNDTKFKTEYTSAYIEVYSKWFILTHYVTNNKIKANLECLMI
jgi:hypothetical protein